MLLADAGADRHPARVVSPELLIITTESMNHDERKDWAINSPVMTPEQKAELKKSLLNERELDAIDRKHRK